VKDHLERGTLDLTKLRFRVLDECDEMLNMGFVDDVEKILNAGRAPGDAAAGNSGDAGDGAPPLQTLLFSATMPAWVKDITRRFLRKGHKLVDLVGDSKIKVGGPWGVPAGLFAVGMGARQGRHSPRRRTLPAPAQRRTPSPPPPGAPRPRPRCAT
jgi:hypothetical protein